MSYTWDSSFEIDPENTDDASLGAQEIRTAKTETRKRLENLIDNWSDDPDGGSYALDLVDDVVLAEHINGVTGTGALELSQITGDLDDISDGSNYGKVALSSLSGAGTIDVIDDDTTFSSVVTGYDDVPLIGTSNSGFGSVGTMQGSSFTVSAWSGGVYIPARLPNGATVTQLDVYTASVTATDLTAYLVRSAYTGTSLETLASVAITTGETSANSDTISNATIDKSTYSYHVRVIANTPANATATFEGIKITYTIPGPYAI